MSFDIAKCAASTVELIPLSDIANIVGGYAFKGGDFGNCGVPVVKIANIEPPRVNIQSCEKIPEEKLSGLDRFRLSKGDVLMAMTGATVGKVGRIRDHQAAYLNQRVAKISSKIAPEYDDFIFALLSQKGFGEKILNNSSGSAQANVSADGIGKVLIPALEPSNQLKIGKFVAAIDDKIDLNRRINQTLEAMAQTIFKSWFVDFDPVKAKIAAFVEGRDPLRAAMSAISGKPDAELDNLPPEQYDQLAATAALFPDEMEESELGEIPRGWSFGTLSDFASFQNGYAFKTKDWTESGHPVVKIGNVKPGIIDLSGCSFVAHETVNGLERFALSQGDLLVGMTGYVGETGVVPALDSVAYLNQRVGRISTANGISDIGYPFCLVRDPAYKAYAESKAHGSAQANVSGKDLMDYQAVVPDTGVLKIFNAQVGKIMNALLSYHEESQSLAALRDTLLPKLLSGELSVTATTPEAEA